MVFQKSSIDPLEESKLQSKKLRPILSIFVSAEIVFQK